MQCALYLTIFFLCAYMCGMIIFLCAYIYGKEGVHFYCYSQLHEHLKERAERQIQAVEKVSQFFILSSMGILVFHTHYLTSTNHEGTFVQFLIWNNMGCYTVDQYSISPDLTWNICSE